MQTVRSCSRVWDARDQSMRTWRNNAVGQPASTSCSISQVHVAWMMGIFLPDFQGYEPWCGTHLSFIGSIIVAALRPLMTFQPLNINKLPGEKADANMGQMVTYSKTLGDVSWRRSPSVFSVSKEMVLEWLKLWSGQKGWFEPFKKPVWVSFFRETKKKNVEEYLSQASK